jgi:hypothetical protein
MYINGKTTQGIISSKYITKPFMMPDDILRLPCQVNQVPLCAAVVILNNPVR